MADKDKHSTTSEDYKRYLANQMAPKERHDFEKQLLEDEFEGEALEGFSQFTPEEISTDLQKLHKSISAKTQKRSHMVIWRIAATFLLLAIFSFIVYLTIDFEQKPEIAQNKKMETEKTGEDENKKVKPYSTDKSRTFAEELENAPAEVTEVKKEERSVESQDQEDQGLLRVEDIESDNDLVAKSADVIRSDQGQAESEPIELPALALEKSTDREEISEIEIESASKMKIMEEDQGSRAKVMSAAPAAMKEAQSSSARSRETKDIYHSRTITGNVSSVEDGENLAGVNVIAKGSANGAMTDTDGNYSITVPGNKKISLVYSSEGFTSEEVEVGEDDVIDINIEPDESALSELVVVGYGVSGDYQKPDYSFQPPRPAGGNALFKDYVKENIRYPSEGAEEGLWGTVNIKVTIGIYGQISNLEVLKSMGDAYDEEAIRLIVDGPEWQPAMENDSAVVRDVKVKIRFRPPED